MKARLLVDLNIKTEKVIEFQKMFNDHFIARSRKEAGCEMYELWQDKETPSKMTVVEVWTSQEHLDAHLAQDWFSEWAPKLEAFHASPLVMHKMISFED